MVKRVNDNNVSDKGKIRFVYAEVEGNNQSLQDLMKTMISAMGASIPVVRTTKRISNTVKPPTDVEEEAVWTATRGYIESVCKQLNGCFRSAYYDAGDGGCNYFMLKDLVERACGENGHVGLNLGRDSKTILKGARDIGNLSAHSRRYNAVAADLNKIQAGMRVTVQELIQIAGLKKT